MPSETFGPFVVDGPSAQRALIGRALDRLDQDVFIDHFIAGEFKVVFRPVGNVPGTSRPAFGFFHGGQRLLEIRHGMAPLARDLRKVEVEYTFLHEAFGHGGELDGVLTGSKRREILVAMDLPLDGIDVGRAWRRGATPDGEPVQYWDRPYEAYCDMLVAAISDVPALFERRYTSDIDPDELKAIVQGVDRSIPGTEALEEPEPLPEPGPKGEDCQDVRDELESVAARLAEAKQRAADIATV